MAKLSKLNGADLVVIEIPAKMALKDNELVQDEAVKRAVITKQSIEAFVEAQVKGREIKVLGTPTGEVDENGLAGYTAFDKEEVAKDKKAVEPVVPVSD